MKLTPDRVNQCRGVATWVLRAIALFLVATGIYLVFKRLFLGASLGDFSFPFTIYQEVGEGSSMHRGLAMLIVGTLLGVLSGPISQWVISLPPDGCPQCGQPRPPGGGTRCPECGLKWRDDDPNAA